MSDISHGMMIMFKLMLYFNDLPKTFLRLGSYEMLVPQWFRASA